MKLLLKWENELERQNKRIFKEFVLQKFSPSPSMARVSHHLPVTLTLYNYFNYLA
jgi:hypothetical protein